MWGLIIVILIIIVLVMPIGNTCVAHSTYELFKPKESYMPYARRILFEAGPEREDSGLNGPLYSWGRQAVNIPYGPLIMPYADTARITDAKVRAINNAELESKL